MLNEQDPAKEIIPEPGWETAMPEKLPKPTYWPFFLAMGLSFIFWGLLTTMIILITGCLVFIIALAGWINVLRHEQRQR